MLVRLNYIFGATVAACLFALSGSVALAAPLSNPSNLSASAISASEIDLSWTDNSSKEHGFKVERSTDGTNFSEIATVGANVTSYDNTNLSSNTMYYYRVRAYQLKRGNYTYSGYSNTDSDTTFDVVPANPTELSATATSSDVLLSWTDNSDNETSYTVERSVDGTTFNIIDTLAANTTSYSDLSLANGTYYYRVQAHNAVGDSAYSNTDVVVVYTLVAPDAPTNLDGMDTIGTSSEPLIYIWWTDNSDNEDSFEIERSTDGTNFSFLDSISANITLYLDEEVSSGNTYYYRVRAVNTAGDSGYSNVKTISL